MRGAVSLAGMCLVGAALATALSSAGCGTSDEDRAARQKAEDALDKSEKVLEQAARTTGQVAAAVERRAEQRLDQSTKAVKGAAEKTEAALGLAGDKTKKDLEKASEEITDAWILAQVKADFIGEDLLKHSRIGVTCDKHVVTLNGTVRSQAARKRAVAIAREVKGVQRVIDRLALDSKA